MVVDIARHLRDEAGQMQDAAYDEAAKPVAASPAPTLLPEPAKAACCTPTAKGNPCC